MTTPTPEERKLKMSAIHSYYGNILKDEDKLPRGPAKGINDDMRFLFAELSRREQEHKEETEELRVKLALSGEPIPAAPTATSTDGRGIVMHTSAHAEEIEKAKEIIYELKRCLMKREDFDHDDLANISGAREFLGDTPLPSRYFASMLLPKTLPTSRYE